MSVVVASGQTPETLFTESRVTADGQGPGRDAPAPSTMMVKADRVLDDPAVSWRTPEVRT
jgi:hypothetical protein